MLDQAILELQNSFAETPLFSKHQGLITRRNFLAAADKSGEYTTVSFTHGEPAISISAFISQAPALYSATLALEKTAREIAQETDRSVWLERYDRTLDEMQNPSSWFWNGQILLE